MQAMEISRTGLDVEWRRLEIIAQNLANANTVRTVDGGVYQPQRLISGPRSGFGALLDKDAPPAQRDVALGVMIYGIEADLAPPRLVHEPNNPQADADGFVSYPGIDQAQEMTLMVKTARIYEANIVAMTAARQMYAKALEIGRQG